MLFLCLNLFNWLSQDTTIATNHPKAKDSKSRENDSRRVKATTKKETQKKMRGDWLSKSNYKQYPLSKYYSETIQNSLDEDDAD